MTWRPDAACRCLSIMQYDARAHLKVEAYGWCWAATAFLDQHPLTQAAFRELKSQPRDRIAGILQRFYDRSRRTGRAIVEDWQLFVSECDYGYDVRAGSDGSQTGRRSCRPGARRSRLQPIAGWQSTGLRLAAGKTYRLTASGRYHVATEPKPWPCEAGGVTIQYHGGRPLGMLLAAVGDAGVEAGVVTPLASPQGVGVKGEVEGKQAGTLYLKINEAASGLSDNSGSVTVTIRQVE